MMKVKHSDILITVDLPVTVEYVKNSFGLYEYIEVRAVCGRQIPTGPFGSMLADYLAVTEEAQIFDQLEEL